MSERAERQYAEDGSIVGGCECGRYKIAPRFHVAPYWFDEIGGASEGGFVCPGYPGKPCGSLCRADGTATPGTEVLWEAVRVMAEQPGIIGVQEPRVDNGDVRAALISARARIAGRKAETSAV